MKGISNEIIKEDLQTIQEMLDRYTNAVWEAQEAQKAHYDKQNKLIRVAMCDARAGLFLARFALNQLSTAGVIEDELTA